MKKKTFFGRLAAFLIILTLLIPSGFETKRAKAESSVTGVIRATELYMREGAGTDYAKVCVDGVPAVLKYGQEVTVLGETDGWYYLRAVCDGTLVMGYSLSKKGDVVYVEIPEGKTVEGSYQKGTIIAGTVNVRKGPSTDYEKVTVNGENLVLAYGQEISIVGEKDGWYHIFVNVDGGRAEGYCLGSFVEAGETVTFKEPVYSNGTVSATRLNVRKGPGTDNSIVRSDGADVVLTSGCKVTILGETDGWYHITAAFNGKIVEGYCLGSYIEVTGTADTPQGGNDTEKPEDKPEGNTEDKPEDPTQDDPSGAEGKTDEDGKTGEDGIPEGYEIATKSYSAKLKNF